MPDFKLVLQRNLWRALAASDFHAAAALLERLQAEDPLSVETRGLELEYLLRTERLEEAQRLAPQLLEQFPASPRVHFLAGRVAYERREYTRAERCFRESSRLREHWRSRWMLGRTLTQLGRLDEAEALLVPLLAEHPHCQLDLAWLYERKSDRARALTAVEAFLRIYPDNRFAREQKTRLESRGMEPRELVADVDHLVELGESVPPEVLPEYVESLLKSGEGARARRFVAEAISQLEPRVATRAGWMCYRLQAYDIAFDLFRASFAHNQSNVKFLSGFEAAAARSGRLEQLVPLYETHRATNPRLHGHLRSIRKRLNSGEPP